ncbi:kinase-like domain-containing protein [Achaetomium macrosporum]|uniref:EKC/KEOPS complex subunit BUD32 n=1 Tax=Achaetomium macrosporum TaxID=79813 RepID=A0AAN7H9S1_9PEZI|nr:kinase-like domain-containing protein [Achaetomium macrosporum]
MESSTSQTILTPSTTTNSTQNSIARSTPTIATTDRTSGPDEEKSSPPRYQLDGDGSEVEDLHNYVPGGYHPVAIGDVLGDGGRFRVVHKLGFGGYATVWLCHDKVFKKWRAVKIMQADSSKPDCADLKALELFAGIDVKVLASNHIQLALEHFWIDGPNGRHLCFVLPFLGPNLTYIFGGYGHVPELMKDICFQLIEAMRFIHSLDLCHGDFRTDNILLRLADGVDNWEEEAIMKMLGQPELVLVRRTDGLGPEPEPGVPAYLVESAHVAHGSGTCSTEIAVIDFGVSYCVAEPPADKGTGIPMASAAPEEVLELYDSLGFHTDVWALGVAIARVRLGYTPFANEHDGFLDGVEKLECVMGPMPNPYRTVWKSWNGIFVNCRNDAGEPLEDDSWKDESVFATLDTKRYEETQRNRIGEGRPGHFLHYRMHHPNMMCISKQDAKNIAAQAAANPRVLPAYDWEAEDPRVEDEVNYMMDKPEIAQMFDLLMRIFKWHPKQRATLDQIANHEWFGDRNRRRQIGAPSAPKCTNNGFSKIWRSHVSLARRMSMGIRKGTFKMKRRLGWFAGTIGTILTGAFNTVNRRMGCLGR